MPVRIMWRVTILLLWTLAGVFIPSMSVWADVGTENKKQAVLREADLTGCIREALENNRRRLASRYAVAMAEARHRQALAGYWPQINAKGGYQRLDESPNFIFSSTSIALFSNSIEIPAQDVELMDENNFRASVEANWLLYDGGMRKGYREQSEGALEMMKQESKRTDLQVIDSVKRLYYGAILAARLHRVGKETLVRMEATCNLTETMYKEGSGRVKKTDWLDNKIMVESIRSMVAALEKNERISQAALANTMGLSWNVSVRPTDEQIPFTPFSIPMEKLVGTAYRFNPDWTKVEAGLRAAEGMLRTARSGHLPKIGFTGQLYKWWNDLDGGLATDRNKDGWAVGIGIQIPVFSGFLTQHKVAEARALVAKIKEEQILLEEGIGLQVKDVFLALTAAEKSHQATLEAMNAAEENLDLNTRAYRHELVDTEKVIRAQLMEALMCAQHDKARYDHVTLISKLNLLVGTEVMRRIQ